MTSLGKIRYWLGVMAWAGFLSAAPAQAQSFNFTTLAGNAGYGDANGPGDVARFSYPQGVVADNSGNIFVADSQNNTIRQITPAGVVSTIAGTPGLSGNTDGFGASALFSAPRGVTVDGSGNLYVADTLNHTIRRILPVGASWTVATIAGQAGVAGTNNGTGTNALFRSPGAIALDQSGRLYVADTYNDTIRLITPSGSNWLVTTLAGTALTAGNTNGTNLHAQFNLPSAIAVDATNSVFVADTGNSAIRKIVLAGTNWVVSTLASNQLVEGIAINGSNSLVAADSIDNIVLQVSYSGVASNLAGLSGAYGSADGKGTNASFNFPQGMTVDTNGFIYVADSLNNIIRKITPTGVVSTLAGLAGGAGNAVGTNAFARLASPRGLAVDGQGSVYLADSANHAIRKATPMGTNWVVTSLAGSVGNPGDVDGTNANAQFNSPGAVFLDNGNNLFVADSLNNQIRKIVPSGTNWIVSTLAGRSGVFYSGNVTNTLVETNVIGGMTNLISYTNVSFVLTNYSVITNFSGLITNVTGGATSVVFIVTNVPVVTNTVGGVATVISLGINLFTLTNPAHFLDGPAAVALFSEPSGVGFDSFSNLYVADVGNNCIRKITPAGMVSTFAGSPVTNGAVDNTGTNALFFHPTALVVDGGGNIFVADTDNSAIRKISPAGIVTTLAGQAGISGSTDGTNSSARFGSPQAIAIDGSGNLYVADASFNTLRRLAPVGTNWVVTTIGGVAGVHGSYDGDGTNALFFGPQGLAADANGNLYIADTENNTLRLGQIAQTVLPKLQITSFAGQVILSWPVSASGFNLETTAQLFPGAAWVPLTNGVAISGANYVLTNNAATASAFYRLRSP